MQDLQWTSLHGGIGIFIKIMDLGMSSTGVFKYIYNR